MARVSQRSISNEWLHVPASLFGLANGAYMIVGLASGTRVSLGIEIPQIDLSGVTWFVRSGIFFAVEYVLAIGLGWLLTRSHHFTTTRSIYGAYPIVGLLYVFSGMVTAFNSYIFIAAPAMPMFANQFHDGGGDAFVLAAFHVVVAYVIAVLWIAQHSKALAFDSANSRGNFIALVGGLQAAGFAVGGVFVLLLL